MPCSGLDDLLLDPFETRARSLRQGLPGRDDGRMWEGARFLGLHLCEGESRQGVMGGCGSQCGDVRIHFVAARKWGSGAVGSAPTELADDGETESDGIFGYLRRLDGSV
jgi:hypothetical protein